MDANIVGTSEISSSFGQEHFGHCSFGDARLSKRAVITADALMRHPGGTLPSKLPKAQLHGFYDFAKNKRVNHDNVLAGHIQRTRTLMEQCISTVLVIHDTTEVDYSGLDIADLGQIGNGHNRGLLSHTALAVNYASNEVIGIIAQVVQIRRKVNRNETITQSRQHPLRESRLWTRGVEQVGRPPAGAMWVNVTDRGGDTFESLDRQQRLGQFYLVRSRTNRNIEVQDSAGRTLRRKLHNWARKLPTLGERSVSVQSNHAQLGREARVRVAAGAVTLLAPHAKYGEHGDEPLLAWVIHVLELDPPPGQAPLEWILLTNVPTGTRAEAFERVDWYQRRPIVEELHKAQKTGCGMELLQFTTRKALEVSIAMLSVVSVQLLRLRDMARKDDPRPATEVIDEPYVEALSLWRWKERRMQITANEFLYALARLGGHQGRTQDRVPGWLVLWRGWMELQRLVEGMLLGRLKRSG